MDDAVNFQSIGADEPEIIVSLSKLMDELVIEYVSDKDDGSRTFTNELIWDDSEIDEDTRRDLIEEKVTAYAMSKGIVLDSIEYI